MNNIPLNLSTLQLIVLALTLLVAMLTALAQNNKLGPITIPAAWDPWLLVIVGWLGGAVTYFQNAAAQPGFTVTAGVVLASVIAGGFTWLAGELTNAGVHTGIQRRAALAAAKKASQAAPKPA